VARGVRENGEEANEGEGRFPEGFPSLYSEGMLSVYGGVHRTRLDDGGSVSGRHCALSPGV
jgi:hypothetical protein